VDQFHSPSFYPTAGFEKEVSPQLKESAVLVMPQARL
jgi:hypothetical protein